MTRSSNTFQPDSRRRLLLIAVFLCVASLAVFVVVGSKPNHYPYLSFQADEQSKVTILQRGKASVEECEASRGRMSQALTGSCKICKIIENRCLDQLNTSQRKLLSNDPVPVAVSRIPGGVVMYTSADPGMSLEACKYSERAAKSAFVDVMCYAANTPRAGFIPQETFSDVANSLLRYLAQGIAALTVGFALLLLLRCISTRHPGEPSATMAAEPYVKLSNVLKRFADVVLSTAALALLFPVLVIVAVLILICEGVPIFYISRRFISTNNCVSILKFRTMVRDAASPKYALKDRFMRQGYLDIPLDCEVYTPLGRLLERTQLVEILQLLNVIANGMSLVGNRPLPAENIELLKNLSGWERRFHCPAGITGIAQVVGKLNLSAEERLELECMYANVYTSNRGNILLADVLILLHTIRLLIFGKSLSLADAKLLLKRAQRGETPGDVRPSSVPS